MGNLYVETGSVSIEASQFNRDLKASLLRVYAEILSFLFFSLSKYLFEPLKIT